jgi:hypothetical protein
MSIAWSFSCEISVLGISHLPMTGSAGLTIWQKRHMPRAPRFWGPRAFGGPALLGAPCFWGPRASLFDFFSVLNNWADWTVQGETKSVKCYQFEKPSGLPPRAQTGHWLVKGKGCRGVTITLALTIGAIMGKQK